MLTILTSKCRSNSPSFEFIETNFDMPKGLQSHWLNIKYGNHLLDQVRYISSATHMQNAIYNLPPT